MNPPIRLLIHGASGRMGQALLRLCAENGLRGSRGRDPPRACAARGRWVPFFAAKELAGVPAFDVAIDFSLPEGFDPMLELCVERGAALVSGTTGLGDAQRAALDAAAAQIPLVWASNFSLGVAVLTELVERAARRCRAGTATSSRPTMCTRRTRLPAPR